MNWIDFIKDWGAHIMSALGILGGLWAYFSHDKKLKSQEKIINDMQIRQMRKTEDEEHQADIKANAIHDSKGSVRIRFVNAGKSDALNVRIEILTPEQNLKRLLTYGQWGPFDMINPQSYKEVKLRLCMGSPDTILIKVTWDDSYQKDRTKTLSIPL